MCGRFSFAVKARIIEERFDVSVNESSFKPRYNCAPSQQLAVISGASPGILAHYRWGLIPFWAKEMSIGNKMINAKAETLHEKPSFSRPFKQRRCLVPADGFFEWAKEGAKQPYRFLMRDNSPFAMAGIWDVWRDPQGEEIRSFSIITTVANTLVAGIHHRMPVILKREDEKIWLHENFPDLLQKLLLPYPPEEMICYPVSKLVNAPRNDVPAVFERED